MSEKTFRPMLTYSDAVHNACIGNYNIGTFLDSFKEKIKKEGGLFKN